MPSTRSTTCPLDGCLATGSRIYCSSCHQEFHLDCLQKRDNQPGMPAGIHAIFGQNPRVMPYECATCTTSSSRVTLLQLIFNHHLITMKQLQDAELDVFVEPEDMGESSTGDTSQQSNGQSVQSQSSNEVTQSVIPPTVSEKRNNVNGLPPRNAQETPSTAENGDSVMMMMKMFQQMQTEANRRFDAQLEIQRQAQERSEQRMVTLLTNFQQNNIVPPAAPNHHTPPVQQIYAKPERLKATIFDGRDLTLWPDFWDEFAATIDGNPGYAPAMKLQYLKNALRGAALDSIKGYSICDNNYQDVVNYLKDKYGDERSMKDRLLAKVSKMPQMRDDHAGLEGFVNDLHQVLRHMERLGQTAADLDMCYFMFYEKLSPDMMKQFEMEQHDDRPRITQLEEFLKKSEHADRKIKAIVGADMNRRHNGRTPVSVPAMMGGQLMKTSSNGRFGQSGNVRFPCSFCQERTHFSHSCPTFIDINDRKDALRQNNMCFCCLRSRDDAHDQNCQYKFPCPRCTGGRMHHKWVCPCFDQSNPGSFNSDRNDYNRTSTFTASTNMGQFANSVHGGQYSNYNRNRNQNSNGQNGQNNRRNNRNNNNNNRGSNQQNNQLGLLTTTANPGHYQSIPEQNLNANGQTHQIQPQIPELMTQQQPNTAGLTMPQHAMSTSLKSKLPQPQLVSTPPPNLPTSPVYMMIAQGMISGPTGQPFKANFLLDSGSRFSFIQAFTAMVINATVLHASDPVDIARFGRGESERFPSSVVEFKLKTVSTNPDDFMILKAHTIPIVTAPLTADSAFLPEDLQHRLHGRHIANLLSDDPTTYCLDVLIGADQYYEMVYSSERIGSGLMLHHTALGQLLLGHYGPLDYYGSASGMVTTALLSIQPSIEDSSRRLWDLENIGILDDPTTDDDKMATQQFNSTVRQENGRYLVHWPWKNISQPLTDNYMIARERLRRFHVSKLLKDDSLRTRYHELILDQVAKGMIEVVPPNEVMSPKYQVHYIPHQAVLTESSNTTKLRVVYDASAKGPNGTSLNDHLFRGPVILADLVGLLLRFRQTTYTSMSDIEKAFLQVGLDPSQRDVCRFIWLKDPHQCLSPENQMVYRFRRVPFGIVSSPFLLGATITHHLKQTNTELATNLLKNIYVDNVVFGSNSEQEMVNYYDNVKALFKEASMNLREWSTNSPLLQKHLPESDKGPTDDVKVLGLKWNASTDNIMLCGCPSAMPGNRTKRILLHTLAKVFDPMGLVSPVILLSRLLFQRLWNDKKDWDEILSTEYHTEWDVAMQSLIDLNNLKPKRHLQSTVSTTAPTLVCFTDASSKAYGAAIYLQTTTSSDLLISKSRVAPTSEKKITIPQMELLAVGIGVKMLKFAQKEMNLASTPLHLFTDSQIVLGWIASQKQRKVFVENRLSEIRKFPEIIYHHVAGIDNPADYASRGVNLAGLTPLWWGGPIWMRNYASTWPKWDIQTAPDNDIDERTSSIPPSDFQGQPAMVLHPVVNINNESPPFDLDIEQFSSKRRLIRLTALIQRAVYNFCHPNDKRQFHMGVVQANEYSEAQEMWDRYLQRTTFAEHFETNGALKKDDWVKSLQLFLDPKGLIRSQGRIENADLPYDAKCPILLPKNTYYTVLTINNVHMANLHAGTCHTLAQLRHKYWLPSGKSQVSNVLRNCLQCRRLCGKSFRLPKPPNLPASRVAESRPFTNVGTDAAGPLPVKDGHKVYVYIFVCMSSRAVHLELAPSLEIDQYMLAFRRFVARRGMPTAMWSDNSPQFVQFHKQIILQSKQMENPPTWSFITPASPWMGGELQLCSGKLLMAGIKGPHHVAYLHWSERCLVVEVPLDSLLCGLNVSRHPLPGVGHCTLVCVKPI